MPVGVLVLCAVECRGLPPGWQRHVREECCVLAGLARAQCAGVPRRQRCPHQVPAGQQASVQVVAWQVCLQCWVGGLASWVHPLLPPTCLTALASQTRCWSRLATASAAHATECASHPSRALPTAGSMHQVTLLACPHPPGSYSSSCCCPADLRAAALESRGHWSAHG